MKSLVPQFPLPGINTVVLGMVLHICFKSNICTNMGCNLIQCFAFLLQILLIYSVLLCLDVYLPPTPGF